MIKVSDLISGTKTKEHSNKWSQSSPYNWTAKPWKSWGTPSPKIQKIRVDRNEQKLQKIPKLPVWQFQYIPSEANSETKLNWKDRPDLL